MRPFDSDLDVDPILIRDRRPSAVLSHVFAGRAHRKVRCPGPAT
jgi:hypothetical protein